MPWRVLALLILVLASPSCGRPGAAAPADVIAAIDPSLGRPLLWRTGPGPSAALLDAVGLDPRDARSVVVSAAPAVWVISHPDAEDADLRAVGFAEETDAGAVDGWRVFARQQVEGQTVGHPTIGIGPGLVVSGGADEVQAIADRVGGALGDEAPHLAPELLRDAQVALLSRAPTSAHGVVLTWDGRGGGVLRLLRAGATQDDAVALAVTMRNAVLPDGTPMSSLLDLDGPLADADGVRSSIRWLADPESVLTDGLDGGLSQSLSPLR